MVECEWVMQCVCVTVCGERGREEEGRGRGGEGSERCCQSYQSPTEVL